MLLVMLVLRFSYICLLNLNYTDYYIPVIIAYNFSPSLFHIYQIFENYLPKNKTTIAKCLVCRYLVWLCACMKWRLFVYRNAFIFTFIFCCLFLVWEMAKRKIHYHHFGCLTIKVSTFEWDKHLVRSCKTATNNKNINFQSDKLNETPLINDMSTKCEIK